MWPLDTFEPFRRCCRISCLARGASGRGVAPGGKPCPSQPQQRPIFTLGQCRIDASCTRGIEAECGAHAGGRNSRLPPALPSSTHLAPPPPSWCALTIRIFARSRFWRSRPSGCSCGCRTRPAPASRLFETAANAYLYRDHSLGAPSNQQTSGGTASKALPPPPPHAQPRQTLYGAQHAQTQAVIPDPACGAGGKLSCRRCRGACPGTCA